MSDENQHWVPKLLLKNFADEDGRVYFLDIHSDEVGKRPPRLLASEPGFNDFEINGKPISFEGLFEKIETRVAPVLKRIIATRSLAGLSPRERSHVARFVAVQSFRTKAFFEGLTNKPLRADFGKTLKMMWFSAAVTAKQIAERYWALMVIEGAEAFYLGDHPVVLQRTHDMRDGSNLGFDVEGVEAFVPLSPKCALWMPCPATGQDIIARYLAAIRLHRTIRRTVLAGVSGGASELHVAQTVIRGTHHIYKAFTEGAPITAEPANVENLNYLQCSWAHSKVFSHRKDFAFARYVFIRTPQYRDLVRTSLLEKGRILVPDNQDF
ncbi:DUF4238 domain-containing protein [Bradyrhizobium genosp. L]|uniref:DUF4238 domain-containing protein n=1 Tax=Bradyrhizobium genosp. L TaxID=83637 RepID=UPI0018A25218|nr:DUF4238 domain-containing protein [Bradyrhizobium genosp. L]QPF85011.1 DUF4238 domain-containing protein [Bradyrhizobium genosp. L]